jgi:hypothetical protein
VQVSQERAGAKDSVRGFFLIIRNDFQSLPTIRQIA